MQDRLTKIRNFNYRSSLNKLKNNTYSDRARSTVQKRPFFSFFFALGVLFGFLLLGSILSNLNKKETPKVVLVKEIQTYKLGELPKIKLQAKIEKQGVIKIVAQTPGIVNNINLTEGQTVNAGTVIVSLASNYNGANAASVQRQLAGAQYQNNKDTYEAQKEIIKKQREITDKSKENTEELRRITENSLSDTRGSIDYNEDLLEMLDNSIKSLESMNADGAQTQAILAAKGQRSQLASGVNQLRSGLRQAEYSVGTDNPPTELANIQKDITIKQLEVQEKSLELGKQVSSLQFTLASINESLMYPSAPFDAVIQKIHVQAGQNVTPGTILATISCLTPKGTVVINVPRNIAYSISRTEMTNFSFGKKRISLIPSYISTEATDGQLYSIVYTLPNENSLEATDEEYITADVPIGIINTSSNIPFIPLDAVYQNQDEAYVFVVDGSKVKSKKIQLGVIYGRYVEIENGLDQKDQVVLTRNVVTGDNITIKN